MNPNDYQRLAARTECAYPRALDRVISDPNQSIRLNHSILGLTGEVGELAGAIEKWIYYGQQRDDTNIKEELGDCLWYIALACNTLGISLADVMEANINKLKLRYPEKFSEELAKEENRDREGERKTLGSMVNQDQEVKEMIEQEILTQTGNGWAEPPDDSIPMVEMPLVGFGDGLKRETWDSSYDRFCSVCNTKPIHRTNELGVCPECVAKKQNEDYLRRTRDA